MKPEFVARVRQDIHDRMLGITELHQEAEKRWQAGDQAAYWNLIMPGSVGDLFYLIDDPAAARQQWERAVQLLQTYDRWAMQNQRPAAAPAFAADYYLRLGQLDTARELYRQAAQQEDEAGREMLSLALINAGAVEQGRAYLRQRVARLDRGAENSPVRWYHLAECWFWLGERKPAVRCIVQAMQQWSPEPAPASVQGLRGLITFAVSRASAAQAEASRWLETALEEFYREGDVEHAMDAKEYLALLQALTGADDFPPGLKILGMSFAR